MLVFTLALAVPPPRIELDLSALADFRLTKVAGTPTDTTVNQPCDVNDVLRCGVKQSRHDYTEHCPAASSTTIHNCPFPTAHAYDHQDKEVAVLTNVWLTDSDNDPSHTPHKVNAVDFTTRSTYLFKYDARDKAGNWAEQVVFALELNDLTQPQIETSNSVACPAGVTVQAASACRVWDPNGWFGPKTGAWWNLWNTASPSVTDGALGTDNSCWRICGAADSTQGVFYATDNIDGDSRTSRTSISYSLDRVTCSTASTPVASCTAGQEIYTPVQCQVAASGKVPLTLVTDFDLVEKCMNTLALGDFLLTVHAEDKAGMYGRNGNNNVREEYHAINVRDTEPCTIQLLGYQTIEHECGTQWNAPVDGSASAAYRSHSYGFDLGTNIRSRDDSNGALADPALDYDTGGDADAIVHDTLYTETLRRGKDYETLLANGFDAQFVVNTDVQDSLTITYPVNGASNSLSPDGFDIVGSYTVQYAAEDNGDYPDKASKRSCSATRAVNVVDTKPCTLELSIDSIEVNHATAAGTLNNIENSNIGANCDVDLWPQISVYRDLCGGPHVNSGPNPDDTHPWVYNSAHDWQTLNQTGKNKVTCSWGNESHTPFSTSWPQGAWTMLGSFYKTYWGVDDASLTCYDIVEVRVVDINQPTITVNNPDGVSCNSYSGHQCVDFQVATHNKNYLDQGASCSDHVDGQINGAVVASANNVDLTAPGDYFIRYDCEDISGNTAVQKERKIIVTDNCTMQAGQSIDYTNVPNATNHQCCPVITVTGGQDVVWHEAGITYTDQEATATDDLDGDLTANITYGGLTASKNLINSHAFYSRPSCLELLVEHSAPGVQEWLRDGQYFLTSVKADGNLLRYKAYCNFVDNTTAQTFIHLNLGGNTIDPTNVTQATAACAPNGMDGVAWNTAITDYKTNAWAAATALNKKFEIYGTTTYPGDGIPAHSSTSDIFCLPRGHKDPQDHNVGWHDKIHQGAGTMVNDKSPHDTTGQNGTNPHTHFHQFTPWDDGSPHAANHEVSEDNIMARLNFSSALAATQPQIYTASEAGKYIITYRVTDSAGNTQCVLQRRTVIVRDTMPPIIALRLKNIHGTILKQYSFDSASDSLALKGLNGETNSVAFEHVAGSSSTWKDAAFPQGVADTDNSFDQSFMATRVSTANAWVVGVAVAVSAVVFGVYSNRRPSSQVIDV